jgi:hypothetical protein
MKIAFALLALSLFADKSFAEPCSSPAAVKFSCVHYSLFTDKYTPIIVDVPAGSECDVAPYSGTIYLTESNQQYPIYSPKVTTKFLARDFDFTEITYRQTPTSETEVELNCTDAVYIR